MVLCEGVLALLTEDEGGSKQEETVIREAVARRVRADRVRDLSAAARERYSVLLGRLGQ